MNMLHYILLFYQCIQHIKWTFFIKKTFKWNSNHFDVFPSFFRNQARTGSRALQSLTPEERAAAVNNLADLLITKQSQILEANSKDLEDGTKSGLAKPLLSRLSLTPAKLKSLSTGLKQIADSSLQVCASAMKVFETVFR